MGHLKPIVSSRFPSHVGLRPTLTKTRPMRSHMVETHEEQHESGPDGLRHHLHTKKRKSQLIERVYEGQCGKEAKLQQELMLILIHN